MKGGGTSHATERVDFRYIVEEPSNPRNPRFSSASFRMSRERSLTSLRRRSHPWFGPAIVVTRAD